MQSSEALGRTATVVTSERGWGPDTG